MNNDPDVVFHLAFLICRVKNAVFRKWGDTRCDAISSVDNSSRVSSTHNLAQTIHKMLGDSLQKGVPFLAEARSTIAAVVNARRKDEVEP